MVLAVLGRVAVSILGDESRLILNDSQIVAMAQDRARAQNTSPATTAEPGSAGTDQPSTAADAAGAGGKE